MPAAVWVPAAIWAGAEVIRYADQQIKWFPSFIGSAVGVPQPIEQSLFDQLSDRGYLVNKRSNVGPVPPIYGTRRVGGTVVFMRSTDDPFGIGGYQPSYYLHVVLVLGEGEIEEITNVYFDDKISTDAAFQNTPPDYEKYHLGLHTGSDDDHTDSDLGWWCLNGINYSCEGTAFIYARFAWDSDVWVHGKPTITADIKGLKVYDPRTSTTAWSDNPALCIRDYLTNTRYGCGIDASLLNDQSFEDSADYCDVESANYDNGGSRKRYTFNGVVDIDQAPIDNLRQMLTSCRGQLIFSAGQYSLLCDQDTDASGFDFNTSNITGGWNIELDSKQAKANRVRARYFNAEKNWQPDIAIVDAPGLRTTNDNGTLLEHAIELPYTSSEGEARQLATIHLNSSRKAIRCTFRATTDALQCAVGDVVTVTHPTPGWSGKEFRVTAMKMLDVDAIEVWLSEYDDTMYTFDQIELDDPSDNSDLPDPHTCNPPIFSSGDVSYQWVVSTSGLHPVLDVQWSAPPETFVDHYELRYIPALTGNYLYAGPFGPSITSCQIPIDLAPRTYYVAMRTVNTLGVASAWVPSYPDNATVVSSPTAIPSDLSNLSISYSNGMAMLQWDRIEYAGNIADYDVSHNGYIRIKYSTQSTPTWTGGTDTGIMVPGSANSASVPVGISGTYMLKPVTSYGQESANMASVLSDWTELLPHTLVETVSVHDVDGDSTVWDEGDLTDCEVSGGVLRIEEASGQASATYATWVQTGSATDLATPGNYRLVMGGNTAACVSLNALFEARGTLMDTWPDFDNGTNAVSPAWMHLWVRGGDTPQELAAATWRRLWSFIDMPYRYYSFKVSLYTTNVDYNIYVGALYVDIYRIDTSSRAGVY